MIENMIMIYDEIREHSRRRHHDGRGNRSAAATAARTAARHAGRVGRFWRHFPGMTLRQQAPVHGELPAGATDLRTHPLGESMSSAERDAVTNPAASALQITPFHTRPQAIINTASRRNVHGYRIKHPNSRSNRPARKPHCRPHQFHRLHRFRPRLFRPFAQHLFHDMTDRPPVACACRGTG